MEKRTQPRFTAQFRSTLSGGQQEGQGKTLDLSISGCKIESDLSVVVGLPFECRLYAPGLDWPIRIDEAAVRWVKRQTFGLEFVRVRSEEQKKLNKLIKDLTDELKA